MKIFLSHASQEKTTAESIAFSLRGRGYEVFLDRDDLPAGASYDLQIERAVSASDRFVFLVSPDSIAEGRYTLTELMFARRKWPDPNGRVLPVMARKTSLEQIPPYLKAVTILEPIGNITAETSAAVERMRPSGDRVRNNRKFMAALGIVVVSAGVAIIVREGVSMFAAPRACQLAGTWNCANCQHNYSAELSEDASNGRERTVRMTQGGGAYSGTFYSDKSTVVIRGLPQARVVTGTVNPDCNQINWDYGWVWRRS